ncbi:hypothetical protein [Rhizobium terrae]|uniref:hypothetical protein n=1 Tax=Rhizobium terrae TaxID=2171756 RepID=UPI000E3CE6C5|nr:hypothetical protein [Rhizobium terrae]
MTAAQKYLNAVQLEFNKGVLDHSISGFPLERERFEPADLDSAWLFFKRELGFRLSSLNPDDLSDKLGLHFVVGFLEDFKVIRYVEMP